MNAKIIAITVLLALAAMFYAGMVFERHELQPNASPVEPTKPAAAPVAVTQSKPSTPVSASPNNTSTLNPKDLADLLQGNPTAAAYAQGLPDGLSFRDLAIRIAKKWAASDPQAAMAWAKGLPTGSAQDAALHVIFVVYALADHQAALAFAESLPDDGPNGIRMKALGDVAAAWGTQNPQEGASLLNNLGWNEPKLSDSNPTATIAGSWLLQDPTAATQWINTLPVGNTRDSAILALVQVEGDSNPATAFSWLRTMANVGVRGSNTSKLIATWAAKDPDAATAAVMQAYPNNNNGRQAALLNIIQQSTPKSSGNGQQ